MKKYIFIIAFVFTASAYGQIGVGHSVKLFGEIENVTKVYYMNDDFYISYSTKYMISTPIARMKPTITVAKRLLNYKKADLFLSMSTRPLPVYPSSQYNFLFRLKFIESNLFDVYYLHFSSGFGIFRKVNPGIDFLLVSIKF